MYVPVRMLWKRPLIPHTEVPADAIAVVCHLGALLTVVLPLADVHISTTDDDCDCDCVNTYSCRCSEVAIAAHVQA